MFRLTLRAHTRARASLTAPVRNRKVPSSPVNNRRKQGIYLGAMHALPAVGGAINAFRQGSAANDSHIFVNFLCDVASFTQAQTGAKNPARDYPGRA